MKSKTRIKAPVTAPITRDQAEQLLNEIALTTINKQKLVAAKNEAMRLVEAYHNPGIKLCDDTIAAESAQLQQWAESNPKEFEKRKSLEWPAGKFGFRTGTPKLSLLNRKWTWETVLAAIKKMGHLDSWIRTKEEVNKDEILSIHAANNTPEDLADLAKLGMKIEQTETFFVDPAIETVEPRTTTTTPLASSVPSALSAVKSLLVLCSLCCLLFNSSSEAAQIELQRPVNGIATVIVRQLQFYPYATHIASLQTSTNLITWSSPAPTSRDGDTLYYTFTNRPAIYCRLEVSQIAYPWSR